MARTKTDIGISIIDLIPYGSENAISRKSLLKKCLKEGLIDESCRDADREMRRLIKIERYDWAIISDDSGLGYYQPNPKSSIDRMELTKYVLRETKRAKSIFNEIKKATEVLADCDHERFEGVEIGYNPYQE